MSKYNSTHRITDDVSHVDYKSSKTFNELIDDILTGKKSPDELKDDVWTGKLDWLEDIEDPKDPAEDPNQKDDTTFTLPIRYLVKYYVAYYKLREFIIYVKNLTLEYETPSISVIDLITRRILDIDYVGKIILGRPVTLSTEESYNYFIEYINSLKDGPHKRLVTIWIENVNIYQTTTSQELIIYYLKYLSEIHTDLIEKYVELKSITNTIICKHNDIDRKTLLIIRSVMFNEKDKSDIIDYHKSDNSDLDSTSSIYLVDDESRNALIRGKTTSTTKPKVESTISTSSSDSVPYDHKNWSNVTWDDPSYDVHEDDPSIEKEFPSESISYKMGDEVNEMFREVKGSNHIPKGFNLSNESNRDDLDVTEISDLNHDSRSPVVSRGGASKTPTYESVLSDQDTLISTFNKVAQDTPVTYLIDRSGDWSSNKDKWSVERNINDQLVSNNLSNSNSHKAGIMMDNSFNNWNNLKDSNRRYDVLNTLMDKSARDMIDASNNIESDPIKYSTSISNNIQNNNALLSLHYNNSLRTNDVFSTISKTNDQSNDIGSRWNDHVISVAGSMREDMSRNQQLVSSSVDRLNGLQNSLQLSMSAVDKVPKRYSRSNTYQIVRSGVKSSGRGQITLTHSQYCLMKSLLCSISGKLNGMLGLLDSLANGSLLGNLESTLQRSMDNSLRSMGVDKASRMLHKVKAKATADMWRRAQKVYPDMVTKIGADKAAVAMSAISDAISKDYSSIYMAGCLGLLTSELEGVIDDSISFFDRQIKSQLGMIDSSLNCKNNLIPNISMFQFNPQGIPLDWSIPSFRISPVNLKC